MFFGGRLRPQNPAQAHQLVTIRRLSEPDANFRQAKLLSHPAGAALNGSSQSRAGGDLYPNRADVRPAQCTLWSSLQKARVHAWVQGFEVHKREEVDRLELAIDGRRTTDFCPHCQVCPQQFRDLITRILGGYQGHGEVGLRSGSQMRSPSSVCAWPHKRQYRGPGLAKSAKNSRSDNGRPGSLRTGRFPPQQVENIGRPVIAVDAGAAQFDHGVAQSLVGREIEFTLAVEACICEAIAPVCSR